MCKVPNGLLLQWWGKLGRGKLSCCTQMLDPTTQTKRGNFGSIPPTDTILGRALLYYMGGLGMGPWVWNVCIYLVYYAGRCYQVLKPIPNYFNFGWRRIWISQITTGSDSKPGGSFKVLIYPEPAVLRIWNVWKTRQFAADTDIGRHEWHAGVGVGGNEIMSACWASHLYTREICGCVEKAGVVGGHSTQVTFSYLYEVTGNQLRPHTLLTQSILKISETCDPVKS